MHKDMTIYRLVMIFALLPMFCLGQKQGNIWYFGINAGLDFNTTPPTPLLNGKTYPYPYGWNEGCSSISDNSGSLLFYTNGMKIWNKLQKVMPNGDGLLGHASSTQSCIIVPKPGNSRFFYVFTTDASENDFLNGLRYSVVDICLDSGYGDVVSTEKNNKLLGLTNEKLICIRHANLNDYWIVTHQNNTDAFYSFRLTGTGIVDKIISHTGTIDANRNGDWGGQMVASPNGLKIAYAKPSMLKGFTLLLDFDPSTGVISNEQTLNTLHFEYGVSFSPDNSKLYFSTVGHGEIYQYNLNAGNLAAIISSKTYLLQNGPDGYGEIQLAPDGKIYISKAGESKLSAILFPNNLGTTCSYIDSAINLGGKSLSFGLPNFIAGYYYSNTTFSCNDTTSINGFGQCSGLTIYPNPFSIQTTIRSDKIFKNATLEVYNSLGQKVKQFDNISGEPIIFNRDDLASGPYFLRLTQDNKTCPTDKLIILDK